MKYIQKQFSIFKLNRVGEAKGKYTFFCFTCGAKIALSPSELKRKKKSGQRAFFCSRRCFADYRKIAPYNFGAKSGSEHPSWSGEKRCAVCDAVLVGSIQRKNRTCGSPKCESEQRSHSRRGSKNPRYIDKRTFCKQCGKEMTDGLRHHRITCSRECAGRWFSEHYSGENSPIWKGGRKGQHKEYPPEWTESLKQSIRDRDNNTCQICGVSRKGLSVHHIDEDKQNCEPENLITLCRKCHRNVHAKDTTLEMLQSNA